MSSSSAPSTSEIPFWFHDRPKWVSGIGRSTTCQDVLHSLVKSHVEKRERSAGSVSEADIRHTCQQLALVEQWRGVERPLSGSSRILKLWNAWGEEREQVRFVVKKISSSSSSSSGLASANGTLPSSLRTRKTRRRNSRLHHHHGSVGSGGSSIAADTIHPSAMLRSSLSDGGGLNQSGKGALKTSEIERLMRIILTQGETIHSQLKRLQERETEIDGIEQEVHDSRTRTAGKDYLLNAYLKNSPGKSKPASIGRSDSVPECLSEMVDALSRVHGLNEQIELAEEKVNDLHCKIRASSSASSASSSSSSSTASSSEAEMAAAKGELARLKSSSDRVGLEMDHNRRMICSLQSAFDERKAIVSRLERDVNVVESEGIKLEMELRRVVSQRQREFDGCNLAVVGGDDDDADLEKELLNEILAGAADLGVDHRHYQLSNSQLYEDVPPPRQHLEEQLRKLHIKTATASSADPLEQLNQDSVARSTATGSPGSSSSTSGNSSGGASGGSEKSVRFSDRDLVMATPDLPPLPSEDPAAETVASKTSSSYNSSATTKSILKAVDPSGDLDSNSDTGLSSLHSSSDEGTYVLDTLV